MDTGIIIGIAGIIITVVVGVFFYSRITKKTQKNKINISAKNNSTIHTDDIVAGNKKSK